MLLFLLLCLAVVRSIAAIAISRGTALAAVSTKVVLRWWRVRVRLLLSTHALLLIGRVSVAHGGLSVVVGHTSLLGSIVLLLLLLERVQILRLRD